MITHDWEVYNWCLFFLWLIVTVQYNQYTERLKSSYTLSGPFLEVVQ